jgi:Zn-dependent M16 (insulinase) family peptidase
LKTGALHLHLASNDTENVFSAGFRTTPHDSTGVAHVLEHTVLCGSEKYPVRGTFFKMLTRSLATFMNAITGSDYTIYPFATQNRTDFYNMLSVYLDAVFKPLLTEHDFMQEGWRLEPKDLENPADCPYEIKGVVYNEMKAIFALPHEELQRKIRFV